MLAKVANALGRALGAVSGAVLSVCWAFAMWVPTQGVALTGISFVVSLLMAVLALFGAIAAVRGHFIVVILVFLASFFPVGVALITADHWLQWIGRLDLVLLAAGVLLWIGRRSSVTPAAAT